MGVWSLGWEDSLKEEVETHPSVLVWGIPQQSMVWRVDKTGRPSMRACTWTRAQGRDGATRCACPPLDLGKTRTCLLVSAQTTSNYRCPFHGLLTIVVFTFLCFPWVISLFKTPFWRVLKCCLVSHGWEGCVCLLERLLSQMCFLRSWVTALLAVSWVWVICSVG